MDIVSGLAAAQQALSIVKQLKDLEKGVEVASFKNEIADLYLSLADVKMALADAKDAMSEKNTIILSLEAKIKELQAGEPCPKCHDGRWNIESSTPHPRMGDLGVVQRNMKCDKCGHSELTVVTPNVK